MNEKRRFVRIPLDGRVVLEDERGNRWDSLLEDVSLKGALFRKPSGWQGRRGDTGRLELFSEKDGPLITMQGDIAHVTADHVGFHCAAIDMDSISHLRRLLELNLGDEALLERELGELISGTHILDE